MDIEAALAEIFTSPIAIIGFLFFFLVIFPAFVLFARPIMQMRLAKALREGGMPTNGRVTKLSQETLKRVGSKTPGNYYGVSYEIEVNGQTYSNQQSVRAETYNALREGGSVSVLYLPATPAKSLLASSVQQSQP